MVATSPAFSKSHQSVIGLALAAAIFGGWLSVHIWAMFFLKINLQTAWLVPLVFALQCWLSVGMFIVAHDAMHGSLVPVAPRMGQAIGGVLLFLYAGFGWRRMRDAHFAHHRNVGTADDPDFYADNPRDFWPWYTQFLRRYFGILSYIWVHVVVLSYYFLLNIPPENIALFYGFPAIASSLQLFYFGTYRPHRHEISNHESDEGTPAEFPDHHNFPDHHRARTNDFGSLASLFSCFHFGYHHEHHLHPGTPWWALPARHRDYIMARNSMKAATA